jgi:hypothetical protein
MRGIKYIGKLITTITLIIENTAHSITPTSIKDKKNFLNVKHTTIEKNPTRIQKTVELIERVLNFQ